MNAEKKVSIRDWAIDDRPREKMVRKGRTALSDAELLAILIGSGHAQETALDISRNILNSLNNDLNRLGKLDVHELKKFKGIGEARAVGIIAALEIGRRRKESQSPETNPIRSSKDAFELLFSALSDLPHEEFWVLYLNRANKLISREKISAGGISGTVTDIRIIFKKAMELLACGIILAHNHPSGNRQPSTADIELTKRMREAGKVMDVSVTDHLIIAGKDYFSFADEGLL